MYFQFAPAIQAGIAAGKYVPVITSAGVSIGTVRDAITGKFVAHAIGAVAQNSPLLPLVSPLHLLTSGVQMYQTHRGFQATLNSLSAIQSSLGVLQATTAVIGVGVAASVALSAVNLHQTLKLREDVKKLTLEVKEGFIDLKKALKDKEPKLSNGLNRLPRMLSLDSIVRF
jgi:mannose/fructose/N-acetylgalactosamine-specific phosphotransferase system component IID